MRNDFVTQALRCGDCLLRSITSSILTDTRGSSVTHCPSHSALWSVVCVMTAGLTVPGAPCRLFRLPSSPLYNKSQELLPCIWWSLGMTCRSLPRQLTVTCIMLHAFAQVASAHLNSTSLGLPAPQHLASPQCGHSPFCNDPRRATMELSQLM